jgi:hypothetical protein
LNVKILVPQSKMDNVEYDTRISFLKTGWLDSFYLEDALRGDKHLHFEILYFYGLGGCLLK